MKKGVQDSSPRVAKYNKKDLECIIGASGMIRNRRKIESAVNNAKRFIEAKKEFGSFERYGGGRRREGDTAQAGGALGDADGIQGV
ncbi:MAG: DNA-3-methyladenine glycosylase I [Candidatus Methanosuratus sp.]|nr:DNA-3-methyladenine glycosylase I [Candidatus Methanosuratincola sp.]